MGLGNGFKDFFHFDIYASFLSKRLVESQRSKRKMSVYYGITNVISMLFIIIR